MIAKAIHYNSLYQSEPFIPINCSAIVELLIESELFGHEKVAFTGASQRKTGKIEHAGNGTILLDEIGEIFHSIQIKLLRFLQEKEHVEKALKHTNWNKGNACNLLGISRPTLRDKIKKYSIQKQTSGLGSNFAHLSY